MRQFLLPTACCIGRLSSTSINTPQKPSSSFDAPDLQALYHVPFVASRSVGRDAAVSSMWQKLLAGHRIHVVSGPDGLGKSCLASTFCEHCKETNRFSCIQWINGKHYLKEQLVAFLTSMQGRAERDVLIVLDDVADSSSVVDQLPYNPNVHFVVTSPLAPQSLGKANLVSINPLQQADAVSLLEGGLSHADSLAVTTALGNVPILVEIAGKLLGARAATYNDIISAANTAIVDDAFSISRCLDSLISIGLKFIDKERGSGSAEEELATLACFNVGDLSAPLLEALGGGSLEVLASQVGILTHKWESESFAMQPVVASILRKRFNGCKAAAEVLERMWPRRMSGRGNAACSLLVWHSIALHVATVKGSLELTTPLINCLDKAANYLAIAEGRELGIAADLWSKVHNHNVQQKVVSDSSIRVARDLGRTLIKLKRFDEAQEVLATALRWSIAVGGEGLPAHAVLTANLAPLMPAAEESIETFHSNVEVLTKTLAAPDVVYSPEERKMMVECILVMLLCTAQSLVDMNKEVPAILRTDIARWRQELEKRK